MIGIGITTGAALLVGVEVGVAVGDGLVDEVGAGEAVGVGVEVGVEVGLTDGVGVGDQTRQTFFFPSFLQTNLLFGVSKNAPTLLQVLPTLGAAAAATVAVLAIEDIIRAVVASKRVNLRIGK